jgi:hypothetical protein
MIPSTPFLNSMPIKTESNHCLDVQMANPNYLTRDNNYEVSPRSFSSLMVFGRTNDTNNSTTNIAVLTNNSCLLSSDNMIAAVDRQDEQPHAVDLEDLGN